MAELAILETKRLRLRPPKAIDIPPIIEIMKDREISRYLARVPYPYDRKDGADWLRAVEKEWRGGKGAVFSALASGQLVGVVGIHARTDIPELGYWVAKAAWGRGYASEMVPPVVAFAFSELGATRLCAATDLDNVASGRVLAKSGFRMVDDRSFDCGLRGMVVSHYYELTAEDWRRMRAG